MMSHTPKRPPESHRSSKETAEKKQKKEIPNDFETAQNDPKPSKVLHVRNLPTDCTEQELMTLTGPFGRVSEILILKGKNQAFVQMGSETFAAYVIDYYSSIQANIRGKPVFFQYSKRNEISSNADQEAASSVLLVTVLNVVYPITIEILHQIFSRFGNVQKIVIFHKQAGFQSLIQFSKEEEASAAKKSLDGQNIYSGCCTLRVQYSNVRELNVTNNNDKSRDFVNVIPMQPMPYNNYPPQISPMEVYPPTHTQPPQHLSYSSNFPQYQNNQYQNNNVPQISNNVFNNQFQSVCFVRNLAPDRITPDILFTLFGVYGNVIRVKIMYHKPNSALIQFENMQQCQAAIQYLNQCPLHGEKLLIVLSNNQSISYQKRDEESDKFTKEYLNSPLHRFRVEGSKNFLNIALPSPALHVSNIDANVTEDQLRQLFSTYGNVGTIKMITGERERKMAIIQMENTEQAVEALINLHNYRFENAATFLRVSFSKNYQQR